MAAFYNLETKNRKTISFLSIYWEWRNPDYVLKRKFSVELLTAYEVSKSYGEKQDEFMRDLSNLQDDFYDWTCFTAVESGIIKTTMPRETDYEERAVELKKIYDWFLPKQRAFADKWGLVVSVD